METLSATDPQAVMAPPIWDNHGCMPIRPGDERFLPELERYRAGGAHVVALNVAWDGVPSDTAPKMLDTFRHWIAQRPQDYILIDSPDDVDVAQTSGRLGVFFNIEGANALDGDLSRVSMYYGRGVRWMAMAYNRANAVGGGCLDAEDAGLTAFGRSVVDEMGRVGMVPCCSHAGARTAMQVIERAATPVIFSHSNPSAVWAHPRNIGDDLIRACAATGGTVGINGIGEFLGPLGASAEGFALHATYVADLVGADHVAMGLDYVFDQMELVEVFAADPTRFAPGTEMGGGAHAMIPPEKIPELRAALAAKGWSDGDIGKLMGGNLRRVAGRAWKATG